MGVGLADRLGHFPSQRSGAEQQRVAIPRAIVKRPQMLPCDELTPWIMVGTPILALGDPARLEVVVDALT